MSRLIIKNLPPYYTPARLKDHFAQKGTVTDAKVAQKPDGTSRRFGFVGFKTDQEAQAAREWFDRSFIDSSRITVEVVDGAKDAPAPRPNKRPRLGPSPAERTDPDTAPAKSKPKATQKDGEKKSIKEQQLADFMQVMQPRAKGRTWANEPATTTEEAAPRPAKTSKKAKEQPQVEVNEAIEEAEVDSTANAALSDLDWMRKRMSKAVEDSERAFEQDDEQDEDGDATMDSPEEVLAPEPDDPTRQTIRQTSRLFVRNLTFSCTEEDLREHFKRFGEIPQVHIPVDPVTSQPKGLAYITFGDSQSALDAYDALDKTSFQGRLLHILGAVDRKAKAPVDDEAEGKKKTVKQQRNSQRKALAGREFNWGMLYMNSDAVVSSVADRLNISKSEILDPTSDNAAVKLALAETHVIQETKAFLEKHGVALSAFGTRGRSDTVLLVKNIPYGTSEDDVRALFEEHGELVRVLVPPAGTMAVVEFARADEARGAFKAVAYRRLGNSVVYLEKGPVGMFTDAPVPAPTSPAADAPKEQAAEPVRIPEDAGADAEVREGTTLFVKNLAFATSSERLTELFRHLPGFAFARVQTKADPNKPGATLSMGYGFVGFKSGEDARKGMKGVQGAVVDGHALSVKWAGRGKEEPEGEKETAKARTTKMMVKNVPFEATKKDIRELFGAHGQLKSVRLPKRFDHRSRGFAFLDFVSRHEAENAYAALKHTHLLGRHLVLEWASEEDVDVEALRRKAGVGYGDGKDVPGKKRKMQMGDDAGDEEDV